MKKETIKICQVGSVYSLFLYFLINGFNEKDLFIFTYSVNKNITKNLKHIRTPKVQFNYGPLMAPLNSLSGIKENIICYFNYFSCYIYLRFFFFFKTFNKKVEMYGHPQTPFSFMFYEKENSSIIEDGSLNYIIETKETHKINPIADAFLHMCGIYFLSENEAFGTHKCIKNIYLTNPHNDPLINDKIKVLNIKDAWNKLSSHDKNEIKRIFNLSNFTSDLFNEDTVLLLTQSFSEDNFMPYDEEIRIYGELIERFKDKKIIIKPHPRETKNYSKLFPGIDVLESSFPIELLELVGFTPDIVCSVTSTALINFKHSKIYVYEGEIQTERVREIRTDVIKLLKELNML